MDKMNVVTFAQTGHILGVVTLSAQAGSQVAVNDVAPQGLMMRDSQGNGLHTLVDATALQVAEVNLDTRVLYRPQLFAVIGGRAEQQTYNPLTLVSATLNGSTVSITLPSNVTDNTEVYVQIDGGALSEPIVRAVTVTAGTNTGSESLQLSGGDYLVAIFAPGHASVLQAVTVP
jgi:hypothetical protein